MPYKSEAQKRYLEKYRPDLAKQFAKETSPFAQLPERVDQPNKTLNDVVKDYLQKNKGR